MSIGFPQHRNYDAVANDFIVGPLVVNSVTPVEVKVGSDIYYGRKQIRILNDSSSVVYINKSPSFSIGLETNFVVYSGELLVFDVNSNPADQVETRLYALMEEGSNTIKITEVK